MKNFFKLFWLNLKDVWKNNQLLFLIVLGFMFFLFVFINLCSSSINNILYQEHRNNRFGFRVNLTENMEQKLDKLISENKEIDYVYFSFECPNLIEGNSATIYALYSGNFNKFSNISIGNWFSSSQMENGENVVVVPNYSHYDKINYGFVQKYEIGTNFDINGTNFVVIGESNINEYVFIIPYNSIQGKYNFMNMHIKLNDTLTKKENIKFVGKLTNSIDCEIFQLAESRVIGAEVIVKIIFTVIFNVQIINLIFTYKYLLDQRAGLIDFFITHKISKEKAVHYLFFEFMLWLFISFFVSTLLVSLFLFVTTKFDILHILDWWEYLLVLIFNLVIYSITFFITVEKWIYRKDQRDWKIEE